MALPWLPIDIHSKMYLNVDEESLTEALASVENAFITRAGEHRRFPGLKSFVALGGNAPTYLEKWRGHMVAVSGSRLWRIDENANAQDRTGVPVSGDKRVIFARTDDELAMAAGGEIVRFAGDMTELLAADAPHSTHVAFIDSYIMALEEDSGRFQHSNAGATRVWDPLDIFAADGDPDNANALMVTPFREILICGPRSVEQYERLATGEVPFFRRWAVGEGVYAPYSLVHVDNAAWAVNLLKEFVRFSGQTSRPHSDDIGLFLEEIDDWADCWATPLHVLGQKFILLQMPRATNPYGTKGVTLIYDYRRQAWSHLYGWESDLQRPGRWPGWSYLNIWDRHFVGGNGKVLELDGAVHTNDGATQHMLGRTAHLADGAPVRIDNLRLKLKRGIGSNDSAGEIALRVNRDNRGFGPWKRKSLGRAGDRTFYVEFGGFGIGDTFQYEWRATDDASIRVLGLERQVTPMER